MVKTKQPNNEFDPRTLKQPTATKHNKKLIENYEDQKPVWRLQSIDLEHEEWGWRNIPGETIKQILKKLAEYESMTWSEIRGNKTKNHSVQINQLNKKAQERLRELKIEDCEKLFRFRFTGLQRI